jgi:hypothetical protein
MVFTHVTGLYKKAVIALLHVARICHRITQYKRSKTSCLTCFIAREAGCCALSGGLLMGASPTCFCALPTGIETAFSDTRCHAIWCTPQQLLQQLLSQCLKSTETNGPEPVCLVPITGQNSLSQGLTECQRSPATLCSLTALTGRFTTRQGGGHNSVPNLRSLGSSLCYSGCAAW